MRAREILEQLREPWWRGVLVGFVLTLAFLATTVWQLIVIAAAVTGFLAGRGRSGAIRGIQAVGPAWFLWLLVLSALTPVEEVVVLLGSILGAGWGLVVFLFALIPIVLGLFCGMAGGYLAELVAERRPKPAASTEPAPSAR